METTVGEAYDALFELATAPSQRADFEEMTEDELISYCVVLDTLVGQLYKMCFEGNITAESVRNAIVVSQLELLDVLAL